MLHPALSRALVTARIKDLDREAARRHAIRLAREPPGGGHANRNTTISSDSTRWTPRALVRRHDAKRASPSSPLAVPSCHRRMT
jgi:hypothetical protein